MTRATLCLLPLLVLPACDDTTGSPDGGEVDAAVPAPRWEEQSSGTVTELRAVWGSSADDVYVVGGVTTGQGERSIILHSADRGATWQAQETGTDKFMGSIWGSGPDDIWAGGTAGVVLHSTGDGSWTKATIPDVESISCIWGSGPDDLYLGGGDGAMIHSSDRGKTWERQKLPSNSHAQGLWGSGPEDVYVVASFSRGTIGHTSDHGKTWKLLKETEDIFLYGVWGTGPEDIFVVGVDSTVLHSADRGATWEVLHQDAKGLDFLGIWGAGQEIYVVSGADLGRTADTVWRSGDAGKTWRKERSERNGYLLGVWGADLDNVWAVGREGIILRQKAGK